MRAEPLTPERLLELERLLAELPPGRKFATLDDDNHHDNRVCVSGRESEDYCVECLVFTERPAYAEVIAALLNAASELLRVYRGASGDTGLAARMGRETRIVTLETEVGRLRELERLGLTWAGLVDILSRPMDLTLDEAETCIEAANTAADALLAKLKERLRDA